ncbi:MAG: hypothetical protein NZ519_07555 [Bacteroidia bacterium]|nr:hypothetical protein [Bacteroidia bacterium]MDW8302901.1 hypothetical protein [Bacteroidia bacterium]
MKIIYWAITIVSLGGMLGWYVFVPGTGLVLESATMQEWAGGAAGSGRGITYRIIAKKKAGRPIKVSSVWIGDAQSGRPVDFVVTTAPTEKNASVSEKEEEIIKADKILIEATFRIPGQKRRLPDDPETPEEEMPKQTEKPSCALEKFNGAGYVSYSMGKKIQYLIIPKFEKLEPVYYP